MKKFVGIIILLFSSSQIFAQNSQSNSFKFLSDQISVSSTLKEIEQTTAQAKKHFENIEKNIGADQKNQADLSLDFAAFRKTVYLILDEKRKNKPNGKDERADSFVKYHANAVQMQNLLQKAIKIYEVDLKTENIELGIAKFHLAWLTDNYTPETFGPISMAKSLETAKQSQNLYSQSLVIQKKFFKEDDESVLLTSYLLANSYLKTADFENAALILEKYIAGIERKYGKKSELLIPALEPYSEILKAIGSESKATTVSQQMSVIKNSPAEQSEMLLFLSPRIKSLDYKGLNPKSGSVVLEIRYKIPSFSNGVSKFPISSASIQSGANIVNAFPVIVTVDEKGKVIEAKVNTDSDSLNNKIERTVREWEFKPLTFNGQPKSLRGYVYYYN